MRRLFAAITPSEEAREHLVTAVRPIREDYGRWLRWTEPDTWHVTLAFYGDQPNDVSDLVDHLASTAQGYAPFQLSLKGAGSFNRRTLWIGVGGETVQMKHLMAECLVDPTERLRQRAHLTVARTTERSEHSVADVVRALSVYEGPSFQVDVLQLFESHLGEGRGGGPRYEELARVQLV